MDHERSLSPPDSIVLVSEMTLHHHDHNNHDAVAAEDNYLIKDNWKNMLIESVEGSEFLLASMGLCVPRCRSPNVSIRSLEHRMVRTAITFDNRSHRFLHLTPPHEMHGLTFIYQELP
ncbi:hypothetical protein Droror1_Dr00011225 [Drosera rotundifolia]